MAESNLLRARWLAPVKDTRGFALALAVFVLVLLAAIVAGGYFSASQEFQIGRGMRSTTASFYAGEAGVREVLENWDGTVYNSLGPGDTAIVGPFSVPGGGMYTVSVVRVGSADDSLKRYYYLEVVGRPPDPARGERRQAVVLRARLPNICCDAAAKVVRQVLFGGGAQPIISGFNNDPPGTWPATACSGLPGDSASGVIFATGGGTNDPTRIEGLPPIAVDPALTQDNIFDFGDLTFNDIAALADHTFPDGHSFNNSVPTVVDGKCDRSNPNNWGAPDDPSSPCFDYFPIIHVKGDLSITGSGSAQGILVVDRNVTINGPFEFYGIILARVDLFLAGPVDVYGGAYVRDDVHVNGAVPRFWLSRCASDRAERLSNLGKPRLVTPRAWVELF